MRQMTTCLRYPGGKSRANKILKPTYDLVANNCKEYREPFIGGGSVSLFHWAEYFSKKPENQRPSIWINDLYVPVYSFWWSLQNRTEDMVSVLLDIRSKYSDGFGLKSPFMESVEVMKKYKTPADIKTPEDKFEAGYHYYILNRCCRSGMTNVFSEWSSRPNVNFSVDKIKGLRDFSKTIQGWKITNLDYEEVVKAPGEDTYIFLDPPYLLGKLSTLYGTDGEMHEGFDHKRFLTVMEGCNHKWLITYNACETLSDWYSKYNPKVWLLRYSMQQFKKEDGTKMTKKKEELLISNFGYGPFAYGAGKENKKFDQFFKTDYVGT